MADGETTLKVYLKDDSDNLVPGVPVTFLVSKDGAPLPPIDPMLTDSFGCANVEIPAEAGVYTITTIAETFLGDRETTWTLVVYDPSISGMTTGGGWYLTEPDTDTYEIVPDARATFGFVIKHNKGQALEANGNLEFQYHVEDKINLKSTEITWLVVSGSNAQFKGMATLNSESGYYFRVTAKDNGEPGVGADWFSIKIWYGDPDTDGTLVHSSKDFLAGGNIMVKTKNK